MNVPKTLCHEPWIAKSPPTVFTSLRDPAVVSVEKGDVTSPPNVFLLSEKVDSQPVETSRFTAWKKKYGDSHPTVSSTDTPTVTTTQAKPWTPEEKQKVPRKKRPPVPLPPRRVQPRRSAGVPPQQSLRRASLNSPAKNPHIPLTRHSSTKKARTKADVLARKSVRRKPDIRVVRIFRSVPPTTTIRTPLFRLRTTEHIVLYRREVPLHSVEIRLTRPSARD